MMGLTKHLIPGDISARDSEGGVGVAVVAVDAQAPVVAAARQRLVGERHARLPARRRRAQPVRAQRHAALRRRAASVPREPCHCDTRNVNNYSLIPTYF